MDKRIPMASVMANPFTVPEPKSPSTRAAIRVVMFPSTMADMAFLNPISMEVETVFPVAISSLIRPKITTLASTAIPMERIIPAIPGRVRVTSKRYKMAMISSV